MTTIFDTAALSARVKTRRGSRPMRAVAAEIGGVSISTLSRVENGHAPDMDTFLALCDWLAASPLEFFPEAQVATASMEPISRIEVALRSDPALSADFVSALVRLIILLHRDGKG